MCESVQQKLGHTNEFLPLSSFGVIDGVEDPEPRGPKVAGPDVLGVIIIFLKSALVILSF